MSIINEALKKAQKRHAEEQAPLPPPAPGGSPMRPSGRGNQPLPSQLFVLFALGAIVLIALSVLGTVYLLRRPAPAVAQAPTAAAPEKTAAASAVKSPPAVLPANSPVAQEPAPMRPPAPVIPEPMEKSPAVSSPPTSTPVTTVAPAPPPVAAPPAVVAIAPPLDPTKPDPKISAYVDALQIAGVRITATSSKVLMNDRVYRQNEIVDRLLGLRLKKIEDDALIFVDERGVTYTKNL
jgi:hypothetical protein